MALTFFSVSETPANSQSTMASNHIISYFLSSFDRGLASNTADRPKKPASHQLVANDLDGGRYDSAPVRPVAPFLQPSQLSSTADLTFVESHTQLTHHVPFCSSRQSEYRESHEEHSIPARPRRRHHRALRILSPEKSSCAAHIRRTSQ